MGTLSTVVVNGGLMFRNVRPLMLLALTILCGVSQAKDAAEHYFELNVNSSSSGTSWCNRVFDWADVTLNVNETIHMVRFESAEDCSTFPHRFPLNEINMGEKGNIQVVDFKYHDIAKDKVITIPFSDNPMCNIKVAPKGDYLQSTLTQFYITYRHCAAYYTVAIDE